MPSRQTPAESIRPRRQRTRPALAAGLLALALIGLGALSACAPAARPGSLRPTLEMEQRDGFLVAVQNGIPVPTFDRQARRQVELSGPWRVQRTRLSADLSLTDRAESLEEMVREADGRERPDYDDAHWALGAVPGALNQPPDGDEVGGWYRRSFYVPSTWAGDALTLKFAAVNYLADVWVNGTHVGYHEGGYTPFAFDVSDLLAPGRRNQISVRVDNPGWGTRNDIVPWGLADWWNYGGITGPVWLEATPPTHLVRADVVPHLDGLDVSILLHRSERAGLLEPPGEKGSPSGAAGSGTSRLAPATPEDGDGEQTEEELAEPSVRVEVLPAEVRPDNLAAPVAAALVADDGAPLVSDVLPMPELEAGETARLDAAFLLGGVDAWSPEHPALYVLHLVVEDGSAGGDELWTSFGLRHVSVNERAQLLLNGEPVMLTGVGLHDERIDPAHRGDGDRASARRITTVGDLQEQLDHARAINADLIRAGHTPANPLLLMLADRLGFAVWEEIPLYHYTPLTYEVAMERGIPQQMLREMALRDMNRPSVLFHGLSNESTGDDERAEALRTLHEIDRQIDGTRLTGQAAYGSMPQDPTHAPLDVVGFTFYYDVFYGPDARTGTARALLAAHRAHPGKPVLALEFGRWADGSGGPQEQARIFDDTFPQFALRSSALGGYVGATVWWTLEDFTTMMPGIAVEHFGLYEPSGERRPAAASATRLFESSAGQGDVQQIESDVDRAEVVRDAPGPDLRLLGYLAYGLAISLAALGGLLLVLVRRGGRAAAPRRASGGGGGR